MSKEKLHKKLCDCFNSLEFIRSKLESKEKSISEAIVSVDNPTELQSSLNEVESSLLTLNALRAELIMFAAFNDREFESARAINKANAFIKSHLRLHQEEVIENQTEDPTTTITGPILAIEGGDNSTIEETPNNQYVVVAESGGYLYPLLSYMQSCMSIVLGDVRDPAIYGQSSSSSSE